MDQLSSMRLFVRVVEMGSFSAVAQQMDVARSVVTRQIAALEAHLGTKLIARSTRRLNITSAGAAYLEKCREILDLIEEAETGIADEHQAPRGHLRITLPFSFGVRHMMPMFADFMAIHAGVSIEVDLNDRRVNLIEGGFDLGIRISGRLDSGDVARKIGSTRAVTVASPEYLKQRGRPVHPRDLAKHECLAYVLTERSSWSYLIDGEIRSFPISGRLEANNGDVLLDAAIRGIGITRAPTFMAEQAINERQVEVLLADFPAPELGIYAVFPGNRYVPHRVRALVDYLAERIGPNPPWDRIAPRELMKR